MKHNGLLSLLQNIPLIDSSAQNTQFKKGVNHFAYRFTLLYQKYKKYF